MAELENFKILDERDMLEDSEIEQKLSEINQEISDLKVDLDNKLDRNKEDNWAEADKPKGAAKRVVTEINSTGEDTPVAFLFKAENEETGDIIQKADSLINPFTFNPSNGVVTTNDLKIKIDWNKDGIKEYQILSELLLEIKEALNLDERDNLEFRGIFNNLDDVENPQYANLCLINNIKTTETGSTVLLGYDAYIYEEDWKLIGVSIQSIETLKNLINTILQRVSILEEGMEELSQKKRALSSIDGGGATYLEANEQSEGSKYPLFFGENKTVTGIGEVKKPYCNDDFYYSPNSKTLTVDKISVTNGIEGSKHAASDRDDGAATMVYTKAVSYGKKYPLIFGTTSEEGEYPNEYSYYQDNGSLYYTSDDIDNPYVVMPGLKSDWIEVEELDAPTINVENLNIKEGGNITLPNTFKYARSSNHAGAAAEVEVSENDEAGNKSIIFGETTGTMGENDTTLYKNNDFTYDSDTNTLNVGNINVTGKINVMGQINDKYYAGSDSDGGAANKVKSVIETSNVTRGVLFKDNAAPMVAGDTVPSIDTSFTYNPATNILSVPKIEVDEISITKNTVKLPPTVTGLQYAKSSKVAGAATEIEVEEISTDAIYNVLLSDGTGDVSPKVNNSQLTFDSESGFLITKIKGSLIGNADTATNATTAKNYNTTSGTIKNKFESLDSDIIEINDNIGALQERVGDTESDIIEINDNIGALQERVGDTESDIIGLSEIIRTHLQEVAGVMVLKDVITVSSITDPKEAIEDYIAEAGLTPQNGWVYAVGPYEEGYYEYVYIESKKTWESIGITQDANFEAIEKRLKTLEDNYNVMLTDINNLKLDQGKDGDGNVINTTYVKKSGDTISGDLTVKGSTILNDFEATHGTINGTFGAGFLSGNGSAITSLNAINISSGTLSVERLADSGVAAGSYGPSTDLPLNHNDSFTIPQLTIDAKGRITAIDLKKMTLPSDNNTDTKVTNTLDTAKKFFITGTAFTTSNTGTQYFDTGVYVSTTAGELVAKTFTGDLNGNAATATKAIQDGNGANIVNTYAKQTDVMELATTVGNNTTKITNLQSNLENYLPLAGGTMVENAIVNLNTGSYIDIPYGDGTSTRKLRLGGGFVKHIPPSNSVWASGIVFRTSDDASSIGFINARGTGDTLEAYYMGSSYDNPIFTLEADGDATFVGSVTASHFVSDTGSVKGNFTANSFTGNGSLIIGLNASNISEGTLASDRLPSIAGVEGTYGPSTDVDLDYGDSFLIPQTTYDNKGRLTAITTKKITLPENNNTDEKVKNTLNSTQKFFITGTSSTTSNTGTQYFDKGVYVSATAGELVATTFTGDLNGNAATATKAIQDGNGANIVNTYAKQTDVQDLAISVGSNSTKITNLQSNLENYLPLAGGTMVENAIVNLNTGSYIDIPYGDGTSTRKLRLGGGLIKHIPPSNSVWASGIVFKTHDDASAIGFINARGNGDTLESYYMGSSYDNPIFTLEAEGDATFVGSVTASSFVGNASSASKLSNTDAIGSTTKPVYFTADGVPTECQYTLGNACTRSSTASVTSGSTALVTSGAVYSSCLLKSGGTMTGALKLNGGLVNNGTTTFNGDVVISGILKSTVGAKLSQSSFNSTTATVTIDNLSEYSILFVQLDPITTGESGAETYYFNGITALPIQYLISGGSVYLRPVVHNYQDSTISYGEHYQRLITVKYDSSSGGLLFTATDPNSSRFAIGQITIYSAI